MADPKNILFISYDGMTDPLGQSQVIPYLKGLTYYGYTFTILSCDKPDLYARYKHPVEESLAGFPITWISLPYHKYPPVISAMWDLYLLKRKAAQLHKNKPFDMVHTRVGTPALAGIWLKKKFRIKFLNDVRDFYADSRVDSGSWNLKNPLYKLIYNYFKRKEKEAYQLNDGIVCLTHAAENIIRKQVSGSTPLEVIPCSVDLDLFNPARIPDSEIQSLRNQLGISLNDIVVSFLGSIKDWRICAFFQQFSAVHPQSKFLLITPDEKDAIVKRCAEYGIDRAQIIIRSAQRKEIPPLLSVSHYSLFFLPESISAKAASPTKHGELMAMGIPVITNEAIGDVSHIISSYQSGIVLQNLSTEEFKQAVKEIAIRDFDPKAIRQGAEEFYDLNKAVQKYQRVYASVLSDR